MNLNTLKPKSLEQSYMKTETKGTLILFVWSVYTENWRSSLIIQYNRLYTTNIKEFTWIEFKSTFLHLNFNRMLLLLLLSFKLLIPNDISYIKMYIGTYKRKKIIKYQRWSEQKVYLLKLKNIKLTYKLKLTQLPDKRSNKQTQYFV